MVIVAVVAALASWFDWFSSVDTSYYDLLLQRNLLAYPDDVIIVAVDEASIERLGAWPWDRRYHAKLLDKLQPSDAVVFDLIFAESQSLMIPVADSKLSIDEEFAAAIAASEKVILPVYIEQIQFRGELHEVLPIPAFSNAAAKLGHAHVDYSDNGIARGVYLREGLGSPFWPHLSLALTEFLSETSEPQHGERGLVDALESTASPYTIYRDYYNLLRFVGPPNTIFRASYVDVLDGLIPAQQWQGKRVFVGATAKGLGDEIPTPLGAMPGVEFHANAYQAARLNGYVSRPSQALHVSITVIFVLALSIILSRLTPVQFLALTFVSALGVVALTMLGFILFNYWFSPIAALLAIILFYPLWSWRRIEIALFFLQQELALLQKESPRSDFTLPSLKHNLKSLLEVGVVTAWSLDKTTGAQPLRWPDVHESDGSVETGFIWAGVGYRLQIDGRNHSSAMLPVVTALLSNVGPKQEAVADSYELVEKTIKEIYSIKDVAEKAQLRMNKSMAELQDAVLVADAAGKIIFTNENFRQLFSSSYIGRSLVELQDSISAYVWLGILRTLMLENERVYQEIQLADDRCLLCQAAMITDQANFQDTLVLVFTDVTQLRYLERGKKEALAFLSHDMRSPIVSLLALIESYRINHQGLAVDKREFIDQLEYFARKNLKYSEDFLQLSRAENLSDDVFQLVDMHGVVDGAYAQIHGFAQNKNVDMIIERTASDCWISGDANLLERAVTNILYNAVQHTPSGNKVTIELNAEQDVQVVVRDEGSGIPSEIIPHLFEPYFRARDKRRQVVQENPERQDDGFDHGAKSYGLGLSFVHTVVKRHGGTINVESEIGKSSSFTLKFPAMAVE